MTTHHDPYYSFKCALSSFIANYIVGVFHPLQLLKTRLQSHDGKNYDNLVPKYQGIIKGLKMIREQQGFKGLFKGVHLTIFTQAAANALFFWIYEKRKLDYEFKGSDSLSAATSAGIQASILTTLLTQPFWVIKTRVLLNTEPNLAQWKNAVKSTRQVWSQSRFRGFYSGLTLNLILSMTGALQMYSYQGSKLFYDYLKIESTKLGEKNFICGGFSKIFTTIITYPFTTIRTRIQQDQFFGHRQSAKYRNVTEIVRKIISEEGITGFYKGLSPNLIRGIPQRGVYFYFYEMLKEWMLVPSANKNQ